MEQTAALTRQVPVSEFVERCVDVPRFLGYCRQCRSFDKTWSCPPYDFSVEELWARYETLLLRGEKVMVPRELQERVFPPQELEAVSLSFLQPVKDRLFEALLELEGHYPGSMALSAGSCRLCGEGNCTRPASFPCRHPDRLRYSIESLGGDVGQAARLYLGEELVWGQGGHLPPYYLLVGGLLMGPTAAE